MSAITTEAAKKHIEDAIVRIQTGTLKELERVKAKIGDQDGDGDVDFADARIFAQGQIDKPGWGFAETGILGAGMILGALLIKVGPTILKFFF